MRNKKKRFKYRKRKNSIKIIPTEQELEARNPVCLTTEAENHIKDHHKSLLRKGVKFVPTPRQPIDLLQHARDIEKFKESVRWAYFHAKKVDFTPVKDIFVMKPWYQRTKNKAPLASTAVECFLQACHNDILDEKLRRKIKDNLTADERIALKDISINFPKFNLRVRKEDKGSRFVITNSNLDDDAINSELNDHKQYSRIINDPLDECNRRVKLWADRNLIANHITKDMHSFVCMDENAHGATPKPLYKLHKRDNNGNILDPCPIRSIITACGTPVYNLAKLCQISIRHLINKKNLPKRNGSTYEVLKWLKETNQKYSDNLPESACFLFSDVVKMYPSVEINEAIENVCALYRSNKGEVNLPEEELRIALKICQECNFVSFLDNFYVPNRGIAMGPSHACDVTDIWMGKIALDCNNKINNRQIPHVDLRMYRDDGLDIIMDEKFVTPYTNILKDAHENVKWEIEAKKEGEYLDLFLFFENGKICSRVHKKSDPIYLDTSSCHDRCVFKGVFKSLGTRLRAICSKDDDFLNAVYEYSRFLALAGHDIKAARKELIKCGYKSQVQSIEAIRTMQIRTPRKNLPKQDMHVNHNKLVHDKVTDDKYDPNASKKNRNRIFWITKFDPRMPHQRFIISKNYHILNADAKFSALYPRNTFISGSRRGKNLLELCAPTRPKREIGKLKSSENIIVAEDLNYVETTDMNIDDYHKLKLCREDIVSLSPRKWLTDTIMWSYAKVLGNYPSVKIIPPSLSLRVKLSENMTECAEMIADMDLTENELSIFFVNDASADTEGSHWSILLYIKTDGCFHHIDTISNYNRLHALKIKNNVSSVLQLFDSTFLNCDTNVQKNTYDCGLFALKHIEMIIEHFVKNKKSNNDFCIVHNESNVNGYREKIRDELINVIKVKGATDITKWTSTTCEKYKIGKECDFCSHMLIRDHFINEYTGQKVRVHGHLRHDYAPEGVIRWFVYLIIDIKCVKYYTGSSANLLPRWRVHKSEANLKNPKTCRTALTRHFINGCPGDLDYKKDNLKIILMDYHDTNEEKLKLVGHRNGPGCRCNECLILKRKEVCVMFKTNSISKEYGLNSNEEVIFMTKNYDTV